MNKYINSVFCRERKLMQVSDLDEESQLLLELRLGFKARGEGTLCLHHKQIYL